MPADFSTCPPGRTRPDDLHHFWHAGRVLANVARDPGPLHAMPTPPEARELAATLRPLLTRLRSLPASQVQRRWLQELIGQAVQSSLASREPNLFDDYRRSMQAQPRDVHDEGFAA